jgi:aldehyde dehydrogenase (NAD+)
MTVQRNSRILARAQEVGRLLAREEGKTVKEGVGETVRAGHIFEFHAGQALRITGDPRPRIGWLTRRRP